MRRRRLRGPHKSRAPDVLLSPAAWHPAAAGNIPVWFQYRTTPHNLASMSHVKEVLERPVLSTEKVKASLNPLQLALHLSRPHVGVDEPLIDLRQLALTPTGTRKIFYSFSPQCLQHPLPSPAEGGSCSGWGPVHPLPPGPGSAPLKWRPVTPEHQWGKSCLL